MSGLRERKKLKAKVAIQECALKLFARRGYNSTTVEQIAETAEISASTFFRYFKSKEGVVLYDSLDPIIIKAFKSQPGDLTVIQALRRAIKEVYDSLSPEKRKLEMQRFKLLRTIPELRTNVYEEMARNIDLFADVIGERTKQSPDSIAVRNIAGAIIGVGMAALLQAYKRPREVDSVNVFDEALSHLESGLSF